MKWMTGADVFVKALKEEKVDALFAYPGGQAIEIVRGGSVAVEALSMAGKGGMRYRGD